MRKTLGIVEVHACAKLPQLIASRRLAGKPVLEWVVRRMTECQRLSRVIVLAPSSIAREELTKLVPRDVPLFFSDRPDALGRLAAALDEFPGEHLIRLSAEHPLVDAVLIDRLVSNSARHPEADYIGYCSRSCKGALKSPVSAIGEWIRAAALRKADREATDAQLRSKATAYLHAHPEKFNLRLIPLPAELDHEGLRLSIDSEEDWEHMQAMFDSLGHEQFDFHRVAKQLAPAA
jgi:spore coat polysaccharide biosynthesis protein SpsF